jgi:hypothetical protein
MKNITLAIDEKILKQVRTYAARQGTTLNALVREHLARLVGEQRKIEEARRGLLELIDKSTGRLGPGYKWSREELYADRLLPRHQHSRLRRGGKKG